MSDASSANRRIARAAGTVMFALVFSNLAGLARQILIASAFGTRVEIDAFNAANRVSETLFNLVAGGALSSAFIPAFTALLAREERRRAWRLASAIANLIVLLLALLSALAAFFAPWVVRWALAPGFAADPAQEQLTIDLLRIMLPSAVIFGLSGLVMGVLNSNQVFLAPALAPTLYQLGLIFGVTVLAPRLGIYGLAVGVLIGATLHLLLQLPSLARLGGRYSLDLGLDSPDVREVARLMGPRLLGVAVVQLNFWINTRLASQFAEGSVTGIVLAFSLMLTPQQAIAQSIAIGAMPTFSAQAALGKLDEMRRSLAASLRGALVLAIPATLGLILLRQPLVALLYEHGQFDARSTELVAWALLWYTAGLVGHSLVEILSRAFYALHDTRTPVLVGAGAMSLNVVFSYLFAAWFTRLGWMPHGGLALANSVATALEAALLVWLMHRRLGGLEGGLVWQGALRSGLAAAAMSAALLGWLALTGGGPAALAAGGGVALGGLVYGLAALLLGIDEAHAVLRLVRRRLAR
ncbi:MAG: murein biosynthesis integral membrane protein MurJ [Chloroflexota bacterium]